MTYEKLTDAVCAILFIVTYEKLTEFLQTSRHVMPLAAPKPWNPEVATMLERESPESLFHQSRSPRGAMAGIWIYLGCWDKAHQVAQDLQTPEGSYWHAIVHRQEPDAGNSNYWFRHAGQHSIFPALHAEAQRLAAARPGAKFPKLDRWDAAAFVNFCEAARTRPGSDAETLAREIQQVEWKMLFDYCARG